MTNVGNDEATLNPSNFMVDESNDFVYPVLL